MKKYALLLAIVTVCLFIPFVKADIIDYYAVGNSSAAAVLDGNHPSADGDESAVGQSFTAPATMDLTNVWFYVLKTGNPTGNAHAVLYGHSGVYGTSSLPNATTLGTSDNFDVTTLNGSVTLRQFTFSGANIRELQAGTQYCIALVMPGAGIDNANYVQFGADGLAPTHSGNHFHYDNSAWSVYAAWDSIFYLFDPTAVAPVNLVNTSDPTFSRDDAGEVNVTVRDWDHRSDLNYHEIQVNTTGDVETFTLRWTEATNTVTEQSDTDNICLLNTSTRTFLDKWTVKLCYNFTMTGGQAGYCDVRAYARDDGALTDTDMYLNQFEFVFFVWDTIGDLINSAFSQFGIIDYMTQATAFVAAVGGQFTDSLVNLAVLINLQFQVIWQIWGWATGWFTRMITAVLNFGNQLQMILNGTHPVLAGAVDLWTYFNFASAGQAVFDVAPLFFILYWIDSMAKRARTQGTIQVLYNDLSAFTNVFAYFMGVFSTLVGFIEGKIGWLLNALT